MKHLSFPAPPRRLCALLAVLSLAAALAPTALAAYELPVVLASEEESVYLYNMDNDTVLLDHNSGEVRYVASTTKMMTALLVIESGEDLENTMVTIPNCLTQEFKDIQATNGTDMNLKIGEQIRLIDLLYGLIVRSANDAASVLAWYFGGQGDTYDSTPFVSLMNQRAAQLGCTGTTFSCPHGLYDHGNVSTAQDLARIAEACYAQPLYMQVAETMSYTLPMTNKHQYEREITNVNFMMQPDYEYYRSYIRGMKTGFTTLAGRCFVTTATQNGDTYMLVVLGSTKDSIYAECSGILDWAFANFSRRILLETSAEVSSLPLKGCKEADALPVYAVRSVSAYGHNDAEIRLETELPERVTAPVKAGDVLGTVTIWLGDEKIDTVDLAAAQDYDSAFLTGLGNTLLLAPILLVLLAALAFVTVKLGGGDAHALARRLPRPARPRNKTFQAPRRKADGPAASETEPSGTAGAPALFDVENAPVEEVTQLMDAPAGETDEVTL